MATIHSLREKLSGKINQIESIDLLEHMLQLAEVEPIDGTFQINADLGNALTKGDDQFETTHYIPDWEADKEVSRWLKNVKL